VYTKFSENTSQNSEHLCEVKLGCFVSDLHFLFFERRANFSSRLHKVRTLYRMTFFFSRDRISFRLPCKLRCNIKPNLKRHGVGRCGLDSCGSGQGQSDEHSNGPCCSIKSGKFLRYLSDCQHFKKDSAPWRCIP